MVVPVPSEPRHDGTGTLQALSKQINEEEDIVVQIHPLLPELDHQVPEGVPGTAKVHHCREQRQKNLETKQERGGGVEGEKAELVSGGGGAGGGERGGAGRGGKGARG